MATFLFIIVIDYISNLAAGDYGYLTHKGVKRTNPREARSTSSAAKIEIERKINDLAFADDLALLESSSTRAQDQFDAYRRNAAAVGLHLNVKKTEKCS